jgi:hypothetical protein
MQIRKKVLCGTLISALALAGLTGRVSGGESLLPPKKDLLFYASLEENEAEFSKGKAEIELRGASIDSKEGINNRGALYLSPAGYAEIDSANVPAAEGTIAFWFRHIGDIRHTTHTYLSWGWNKEKYPYGVFSLGWWERDGGQGALYFMPDNVSFNYIRAAADFPFHWAHYAVVWRSLPKPEMRFYENGIEKRRVYPKGEGIQASARIATPVYIGADLGTSYSRGYWEKIRRAHGYMNNLTMYSRFLSEDEIAALKDAAPAGLLEYMDALKKQGPCAWMSDAAQKAPREKRDREGRLLESRVIFDESPVADQAFLGSPAKTDALIDRVSDAGFNVYAPCVCHGGGAHYKSSLFKESTAFQKLQEKQPGYDPVAYCVKKAHERGMEVHSWFCVFYNHPEEDGKPVYPEFGAAGSFYNGYDPKFRDHVVGMILEHAQNYNVDGIILDFIRLSGGLDSAEAEAEYKKAFGRDLKQDKISSVRMAEFAAYCVNDVVRRVSEGLRKSGKKITLSIAGEGSLKDEPLPENGRNPALWVDKGWIDAAYYMAYGMKLPVEIMDKQRGESKNPAAHVFIAGNYDEKLSGGVMPREPEALAKLVDYCRRKYNDGNGSAVYLYSMLSDGQIKALKNGPFKERAVPFWSGSR